MAWKVELDPAAERELSKLDRQVARRILAFLHGRVAVLDDPRSIGEALKGSKLGEFWKYRVGDYRIISRIEDGALCVLVVKIGNRREVYR
ncbi:MAG: type II toxin-antitoxin system RelE/ParE family toxin [Hydrotalea sp. AMD]|uniref:type II toxin-antitoxin system RelE family toxin n=1 Tax=Hydrotalea sp. AMD TaxID=2501297 RepID=UPI001027D353|nr:type II toxin-antitoxin system RelE/ParE family toxin [Hydrotalea sp. AMD]RWZ85643.1 MAG: type II toxin-antitoxin system RelE/ParE family toxin [Hydrotalea sp. AMD]